MHKPTIKSSHCESVSWWLSADCLSVVIIVMMMMTGFFCVDAASALLRLCPILSFIYFPHQTKCDDKKLCESSLFCNRYTVSVAHIMSHCLVIHIPMLMYLVRFCFQIKLINSMGAGVCDCEKGCVSVCVITTIIEPE